MTWQEAVVRLIPTAVAAVAGFIAWRKAPKELLDGIFSPQFWDYYRTLKEIPLLLTRCGILPKSLKRVSSTNLPLKKKEAMLHEASARLAFL